MQTLQTIHNGPASDADRWYVAKTSGMEGRARRYFERAGIKAVSPEIHRYFSDKRTGVEKCRVGRVFPGYIFFRPSDRKQAAHAWHVMGVAYVLGERSNGGDFVAKAMPVGWVERLIEAGPIIEGKRKKFCNGDEVKLIIGGLSDIIATVISHAEGHPSVRGCPARTGKVIVETRMFGALRKIQVDDDHVEVAL